MATDFRASQRQIEAMQKMGIAYPEPCSKLLAGKLISEHLGSLPATQGQISYLKFLGYEGDLGDLSFSRASTEIERLRMAELKKKAQEALGF